MSKKFIATYRIVNGVLILVAIVTQLFSSATNIFSVINFFSYFTILANLFAASVLIASTRKTINNNLIDYLRGASTLYMLITGLGFSILLGGQNSEFIEWVNIALHYVAPFIILLDWILFPHQTTIPLVHALRWILFPILYLIYSLVRGSVTNWYPYPILNPTIVGLDGIFNYSLGITIAAIAAIWIITKLQTKIN